MEISYSGEPLAGVKTKLIHRVVTTPSVATRMWLYPTDIAILGDVSTPN